MPGIRFPDRRALFMAIFAACGVLTLAAFAQQPAPTGEPAPATEQPKPPPPGERSQAERIIRILSLREADRVRLEAMSKQQGELQVDYDKAQTDFAQSDAKLTAEKASLTRATDAAEKARLTESVAKLEKGWNRRRDHFDLIIQRRKALQAELETLKEKMTLLSEISGQVGSISKELVAKSEPAPAATGTAPAPAAAPSEPVAIPGMPSLSALSPPSASKADAAAAAPAGDVALDPDLIEARKADQAKQAALNAARARTARLASAVDVFERDLISSRKFLESEQQELAAAEHSLQANEARLAERRAASAPEDEITRITNRRAEHLTEVERLKAEVDQQTQRIADSEVTVQGLKKSRDGAVEQLQKAEAEAKSSRQHAQFLEGPFAPHHISLWFTNRAPRVIGTVIFAAIILVMVRVVGGHIVGRSVQRGQRGSAPEREGRGKTLQRVFESTATVAIIVMGVLGALNQAGIDVTVLLGSAAVVGAAVAFGSQNLIKDFFSGFMILIENQYSVGNVVRIGDTTGTVEDITLRMTALRDLEGVVHFIPHSQVVSVSNLTYGWSRIVLDVKVASAENVDRVMAELLKVAKELKGDAEFGPQIVEDPEMLGVDAVGSSSTTIKLLVKTRPLNRWLIKREMLRRIKTHFDKAGIKFG